jgi:hypothetical protein
MEINANCQRYRILVKRKMNMTFEENSLAGYAGVVGNVLSPLNQNERFKRQFRHKNFKILMNCPYWTYAALVSIEKGTIRVDGIKNKPVERIDRDVIRWNIYLETNILIYGAILAKRKTLMEVAKEWLRGELKIKGILYLPDLLRLYNCLYEEKLQYDPLSE